MAELLTNSEEYTENTIQENTEEQQETAAAPHEVHRPPMPPQGFDGQMPQGFTGQAENAEGQEALTEDQIQNGAQPGHGGHRPPMPPQGFGGQMPQGFPDAQTAESDLNSEVQEGSVAQGETQSL